ncbi:MAG: guanylate kinase [Muribaculaceae bacterium]|nr:guanylate kinase [Muribaculaceae bacterium]
MKTGKLIVISAPSGTGKSTIIGRLIDDPELKLEFSVSATTRAPRQGEQDGVNYYFMTTDQFRKEIEDDAFAEYQEVYEGRYYGTLKREIERINRNGKNVIMDVDVLGGINVKKLYGSHALSIFIQPPSVEVLRQRLISRATDSMEDINNRVAKAEYEIGFAPQFDRIVINDVLDVAVEDVRSLINNFVNTAGTCHE